MQFGTLTSAQNPKIKEILSLRERKEREKTNLFLIEGYRELKRALKGQIVIKALYFSPSHFLGENENALLAEAYARGVLLFSVSKELFEKISYRDRPDGLLAIAHKWELSLTDLTLSSHPFFVVAESIEKPGNLGTMLRSADAVNVDGFLVCDRCTDIFNPNVVRASVGTLFTIPVLETKGQATRKWLKENKIKRVATSPDAECLYTKADLTGPVAIVVGTEQTGLSEAWLNEADLCVRIPMLGEADSLNVATATTLLLYEVLRQREGL